MIAGCEDDDVGPARVTPGDDGLVAVHVVDAVALDVRRPGTARGARRRTPRPPGRRWCPARAGAGDRRCRSGQRGDRSGTSGHTVPVDVPRRAPRRPPAVPATGRTGPGAPGYGPAVSTTLVTWNLKGSGNPDTAASPPTSGPRAPTSSCCRRCSGTRPGGRPCSTPPGGTGVKHWPVRTWPEGMAVIGVTVAGGVPPGRCRRWRLWSWRRRILQMAWIGPDRPDLYPGERHLTPHGQIGLRAVETATVLGIVAERGPRRRGRRLQRATRRAVHRQLAAAGCTTGRSVRLVPAGADDDPLRDGPSAAPIRGRPTGAAGGGARPIADQRLDYVYGSAEVRFLDVRTRHPRTSSLRGHLRPPAGHRRVRRGDAPLPPPRQCDPGMGVTFWVRCRRRASRRPRRSRLVRVERDGRVRVWSTVTGLRVNHADACSFAGAHPSPVPARSTGGRPGGVSTR